MEATATLTREAALPAQAIEAFADRLRGPLILPDHVDYEAAQIYVNFPGTDEEAQQRLRATLGPNYARLVTVKKQYDPDNFFCMNTNINPAQ